MADSPFRSKRGLIQTKMLTPKRDSHNLSTTILPNELNRFVDNSILFRSSNLMEHDDSMSVSTFLDANSESQHTTATNKTDLLFSQFFEVLQGRTNDSEIFDTIQDLVQTCAGVLDELQKDVKRGIGGAQGIKQRQETIAWLQEEVNTWKLLHALYNDRISLQAEDVDVDMNAGMSLGGSEKEVITQLYSINSTLREYQLIVDWLESIYKRRDGTQVGHTADRSVAWENTLFHLNNTQDVAFGKGTDLVHELDPDAPIREKRPLHALDAEDNLRLSRCIFEEIRKGCINEAMALCKFCGQTWRAAILEGWRLHEDPNYESETSDNVKLPIEGNPRRDVWKKCIWMMADSNKFDEYTRAIAGVFCGHLESLKSLLSNSWQDLLWAYLKVQIDIRVECEIRACCMKHYYQMPEEYWNGKMTLEQIFEELLVAKDAAVRDYATSHSGVIQQYLILDNFGELLQRMSRWLDDDKSVKSLSSHKLRFLTHIILFMRQIGRIDQEQSAERIIAAYVETLIERGDSQLVAFYAAALPPKVQIKLYSKFLENITDTTSRSVALDSAIKAGLDVEDITRHTVETIRLRMHNETDANTANATPQTGSISNFDQQKISALEWLTFITTQRGELLWQANAMIRYFLGESKTECVRAAYAMVPTDSLAQLLKIYGSNENLPCRDECSVKEYLCYKIYLASVESFNDWSHLFHNQPNEPQPVMTKTNFTDRMATEHREQVYRTELKRWQLNLEEQTKLTTDALYNVLLFPEKGWLIDPDTSKEPVNVMPHIWEHRQIQLDKLRSICIPEIVLLLHTVLHQSKDFKNCVKLADEISNERRQLYKVYTKHKLAELLSKIAESSRELLNQKLDPWGFPNTI